MPRVPFYQGPIASAVLSRSPVAEQPDYERLGQNLARDTDGIFKKLFYNPKNDPAFQEAKLRAAQTAEVQQKIDEQRNSAAATSDLASNVGDYAYRYGIAGAASGSEGTRPYDIAQTYDDAPTVAGPAAPIAAAPARTPEQDLADVSGLANTAYARAVGDGADPKKANPILQAFNLTLGNDAGIVRTNAALDGKYLGKDASPSLARQDYVREDEQSHDMEKNTADLRMKKYGFDLEHGDRVLNIETDAGTQRRGQDMTAGTSRRGQDIEHSDRLRAQDKPHAAPAATTTTTETIPAQPAVPAKHKFLGLFGDDVPGTPAKNKTVIRTTRPAASSRPPLSAFGG